MAEKWTRRDAARALVGVTAARAASGGQQPPARDLLAEARRELKETRKQLRQVELSEATPPAFVFRP